MSLKVMFTEGHNLHCDNCGRSDKEPDCRMLLMDLPGSQTVKLCKECTGGFYQNYLCVEINYPLSQHYWVMTPADIYAYTTNRPGGNGSKSAFDPKRIVTEQFAKMSDIMDEIDKRRKDPNRTIIKPLRRFFAEWETFKKSFTEYLRK